MTKEKESDMKDAEMVPEKDAPQIPEHEVTISELAKRFLPQISSMISARFSPPISWQRAHTPDRRALPENRISSIRLPLQTFCWILAWIRTPFV